MEQFTIRDFSGGLNTAMDEANLPANMTASILNVDVLESRAIRRRNGYFRVTATPLDASAVDAIYRYYQSDGDRYFVAVAGTALYSQQYVSTSVPQTRLEAESATITGPHSTFTQSSYSSGQGVYCYATCVVDVPYSTYAKVYFGDRVTASVQVDSNGYVSVTASSYYAFSALSATTHTVSVKHPAVNASALALAFTNGSQITVSATITGSPTTARVRFYDTATYTDQDISAGVYFTGGGTGSAIHTSLVGVGVDTSQSSTHYVVTTMPSGVSYTTTPVARSTGWHTIEVSFAANGWVKLDGTTVYTGDTSPFRTILDLSVGGNSTYVSGTYTWYFDAVEFDYTMFDDFGTYAKWTTYYTSGTASKAISAAHYFRQIPLDCIDYSAVSTYTKQLTTLTATTDTFAFATLNNNCYFSSAYDQLSKFDGSSVTAITATNTPSCAYLAVKGRRMFGAGSATDPSKLYYSELDNAEDWGKSGTQNGIYVAGRDAGGTCTGLAVANDLLYFFSQSRTYGLDTRGLPANWESRCLSESHGCVAPKSIAVAPNAVIFLAADGVRAHGTVQGIYSDDGSAFTILSDNITPTLNAYTDVEKAAAVGIVYKNRYWLAIGSDVLVCDLEKRTENNQPPWTKYDAHDVNCFAVTRSDEYGLYSGSKTSGHIYRLDYGGTDNGSAISLLYKTPPIAPRGYTTVKHFRNTHLAVEAPQAQSLTVTVTTDDVSAPAITASFTPDTDIQPKRLLTPARGRSAQVKLSSDGLEQDITISELTMTYNPRPKVR